MIFNCSERSETVRLPEGTWQILADGNSSMRWTENATCTDKVAVAMGSALILGSK